MWLVTDTELFCPCKKFTRQCCFRRKNLESNVTKKKKKKGRGRTDTIYEIKNENGNVI